MWTDHWFYLSGYDPINFLPRFFSLTLPLFLRRRGNIRLPGINNDSVHHLSIWCQISSFLATLTCICASFLSAAIKLEKFSNFGRSQVCARSIRLEEDVPPFHIVQVRYRQCKHQVRADQWSEINPFTEWILKPKLMPLICFPWVP